MSNKLLDIYLDWATACCDAPDVFHQATIYSIVGTLLRRRRFIYWGAGMIYPNTWMVLIAPSSVFRKSTSINMGISILKDVDRSLVYPSEFSHERLTEILRDQVHGTFVFYELMALLDALRRDYMAGTKALITELYDCPDVYKRFTKGAGDVIIEKPAINIISATTIDWIRSSITDRDLMGGLLPRFLFIPASEKTRTMLFPERGDHEKRCNIEFALKDINELMSDQEYVFNSKSKDLFKEFKSKLDAQLTISQKKEDVLFARSDIYLLKLAIIIQTMREPGSKEISVETITEAITFLEYCNKNIQRDIVDDLMLKDRNELKISKIFKIIKRHPGGLTDAQLLKNSRYLVGELGQITETLQKQEVIKKEGGLWKTK